jgi:hypothetical protein
MLQARPAPLTTSARREGEVRAPLGDRAPDAPLPGPVTPGT